MKIRRHHIHRVIVAIAVLSFASFARAGNDTWTSGGADNNWSTPDNWGGVAPVADDSLFFGTGARTTPNDDFAAGTAFSGIYFNSGAEAFTLGGNDILLSGTINGVAVGVTNGSSSVQTMNNNLALDWGYYTFYSPSGSLNLDGALTLNPGSVADFGTNNVNSTSLILDGTGLINGLGGAGLVGNNGLGSVASGGGFAALATISGGVIVPYTYSSDPAVTITTAGGAMGATTPAAATNIEITTTGAGNFSLAGGTSTTYGANDTFINTILLTVNSTTKQTGRNVPSGTGTLVLGSTNAGTGMYVGGIYLPGGQTAQEITIGGGASCFLTAGPMSGNPVPGEIIFGINGDNTSNEGEINTAIQDNLSGGAVSVIYCGGGSSYINSISPGSTYSGGTYIIKGRIQWNYASAMGVGPVYVSGGDAEATLQNAGAGPIANAFFLSQGSSSLEGPAEGSLRCSGTSSTMTGAITLMGNPITPGTLAGTTPATIGDRISEGSGGKIITFTGPITGTGTLEFYAAANPCSFVLDNATTTNNSWTGGLIVDASGVDACTVQLGAGNQLQSNNVAILSGGGAITLDLNGQSDVIGTLTGGASANNIVNNSSATANSLTIGVGDGTAVFGGIVENTGGGALSLTKTGAGTQTISGANSYTGSTTVSQGGLITSTASTGAGSYSVADGATLGVQVPAAGSQLNMSSFTLGSSSGCTLLFDTKTTGNPTVAPINVTGALTMAGTINVEISGTALAVGSSIPLISYNSESGSPSFNLVTPPGVIGTVSDDHAGHVTLDITAAGDSTIEWIGNVSGDWDINNSANTTWQGVNSHQPTYYIENEFSGDAVQFDDNATGTTTVNVTTTVSPAALTVNNATKNFTLTGTGKISGSSSVIKSGAGSITLSESGGDNFSGGVSIAANGGTVVLDGANSIVSGSMTIGSGSALQIGDNDAGGNLSGGVTDNGSLILDRGDSALNVSSVISGSGAVANNGSGTVTISGTDTFTGATTVNDGVLALQGPNGAASTISSSSGLTINNGGTVTLLSDNSLGNPATGGLPITINAGGTLTGNNAGAGTSSHLHGLLTLNGGTLAMGGSTFNAANGTWDLQGGVTVSGGATTSTMSAQDMIPDQTGGTIFNVANGGTPSGIDLNITGTLISGSSQADTGIIKNGNGTMALDNNNSYTIGTTLNAGTIQLGEAGDAAPLTTPLGTGAVVNNGTLSFASSQSVTVSNAISGTGSLVVSSGSAILATAASYSGNTTVSNGTLQLASGSSISVSPVLTFVNGGLSINVANNGSSTINFTNSTLTLAVLSVSPNLTAGTINFGGTTNIVTVTSVPRQTGFPSVYPLIKYNNAANGISTVGLSPLPNGFGGYLSNDVSGSQTIYLVLISGPFTPTISWNGNVDGIWGNNNANDWLTGVTATNYVDGDVAVFNNAAATKTVALTNAVYPGDTYVSNTVNYTFTGAGGVSGTNGFFKDGTGTLVLDNSGTNDFSGGMNIIAGTVQVGNGDGNGSVGTGTIGNNGSLVFNRNNGTLVISNSISGSGSLNDNGSGSTVTLSGNSSFDGAANVAVNNTLVVANNNALGSTAGATTISNGATLDVEAPGLAANALTMPENVIVSGAGVDSSSGVIVNSGANSQLNALQQVTLAGDTTFGGVSRWDIRGAAGGANGSLSTDGNAYNLTKVGGNFIGIANATVDSTLGNVDVKNGTLDFEGNTTGLGNPASMLSVESSATFEMWSATNQLNKNIAMSDGSTLLSASGNNIIAGPMALNGSVNVTVTNSTLTLSNAMSGTGPLNKNSTGTLTIAGMDAHSGGTTINDGTFILNGISSNPNNVLTENASQLLSAIPVVVGGSGTNVGPVDIEDTLHPGADGHPSTFTLGNGPNNDYPGQDGTLMFGAGGGGSPSVVFDLGSIATIGGGVNDLVAINGDLEGNFAHVKINPLGVLDTSTPYTLITYTGAKNGNFNSGVALLSGTSRYSFTLNYPANAVTLSVSGGPAWLKWNNAANTGIWDMQNSQNWLNTGTSANDVFYNQDSVVLDDSILSAANPLTTITIPSSTAVSPTIITNNSTTANFTITGAGKITGAASLIKLGTSTLTLATLNDFTGNTLIAGGTVIMDNANALGSTNGIVYVTNGATLDVSGITTALVSPGLGQKVFNIAGSGVGGEGAIVNSSTVASTLLHGFENVTLAADASIGGTNDLWPGTVNSGLGRIDIGRDQPGILDLAGHTLTKTGNNFLNLATMVNVTAGDIVVNGGALSFDTNSKMQDTSAGSYLIMETNTVLQTFNSTAGTVQTPIVFNGSGINFGAAANSLATIDSSIFLNNTVAIGAQNSANASTLLLTAPIADIGSSLSTSLASNPSLPAVPAGVGSILKTNGTILQLAGTNTYSGSTVIAGGTLALTNNGSISSSANITVFAGATLDASKRVDGALTLNSGQTLAGNGTISGNLSNNVGSVVSPGTNGAIGKLTVTGNVYLNGTTFMKLDKGNLTNDVLAATGNVNYGGTLSLTNLSGTLAGGDQFKLFNAATYPGNFTSIIPAHPNNDSSLNWDTTALDSGILKVAAAVASVPQITSIGLSGTTLTITATNGSNGGQFVLLQSTNVALPLAQWTPVLTNTFDGSGNLDLSTNIVNSANEQEFYILQTQ